MSTVAELITSLNAQKDALAANLVTKGVAAKDTEGFSTLVPKVLEIQGGGGAERKVLVFTGWSYGNGVTDIKISDYINDYSKIKRLTYRCDKSQANSGCLDEFIGEKAYSGAVSGVTMNGKSLEYIFNVFDTAFLSKYFINAINNGYYASSDFYRAGQNQVFQMGVTTEGYLTIPLYATNPTNEVFYYIANSFSNGYQYIIIEYEE